MKKGLTSLSDDLEETVKGINDFKKSLNKALKDLKNVSMEPELKTVSSSSKHVVPSSTGQAKTAAASTLFNLLSGSPSAAQQAPPTATASVSPTIGGPPKRPASGAPPKAPIAGARPKRSNLPPAPKLPPTAGSGPPQAPNQGTVKTPSFAKRPTPPAAPAAGIPARPPGAPSAAPAAAPVSAPQAGGGLSSLRDEMLEELNRLKKIMRGD